MRPFLLLATRAEDEAADGEYAAFLRATGLSEGRLRRIRGWPKRTEPTPNEVLTRVIERFFNS